MNNVIMVEKGQQKVSKMVVKEVAKRKHFLKIFNGACSF